MSKGAHLQSVAISRSASGFAALDFANQTLFSAAQRATSNDNNSSATRAGNANVGEPCRCSSTRHTTVPGLVSFGELPLPQPLDITFHFDVYLL